MPQRQQLISQLQGEHDYGVLLLAQMGGVPNEIQLMIETAVFDEAAGGLRPRGNFIIRALGVREHRVELGVFGALEFAADHVLLHHHNTPRVAVHFDGKPDKLNELILDISQVYISTYGRWRNVAEIRDDLNTTMPLTDLLSTGFGLLGTMPKPLADKMAVVLAHHGIKSSLAEDSSYEAVDEHGRSRHAQALLIDKGYVVALDFSVEPLGRR